MSLEIMQHFTDFSLKLLNTFGIDVTVQEYLCIDSVNELKHAISDGVLHNKRVLILGGGSNLLFNCNYFEGVVVHVKLLGINIIEESNNDVLVKVGAGVVWDDFVDWCVENGYHGVENLSYIPGCVGASPVQNIGAYGVEVKDVFDKADGVYINSGHDFFIDNASCKFNYRYSIFKDELKNQVILTNVYFRLSKNASFNIDYGSVKDAVSELGEISLKNIRTAIVDIRKSKLPEPSQFGNAGSFFKNPVIEKALFDSLKSTYPLMPSYTTENINMVKVPAGWLIENAGWKGKYMGRAGVHKQQALVLINTGGATGNEIIKLAESIEHDIFVRFGINLEREVNVI